MDAALTPLVSWDINLGNERYNVISGTGMLSDRHDIVVITDPAYEFILPWKTAYHPHHLFGMMNLLFKVQPLYQTCISTDKEIDHDLPPAAGVNIISCLYVK